MNASDRIPQTVLVVEEDQVLCVVIEDVLRKAGVAEISICSNIEAAMVELGREQPEAIILDIHLAERDDGWELAEIVNFLGPPHPRIIFSTTAPHDIPPNIARLGSIFEKPFDPALLVEALRSHGHTGLFSRFRDVLHRPAS